MKPFGYEPFVHPYLPLSDKVLIRCLGLGKEHEFLSVNVRTNRVCDRCRSKLMGYCKYRGRFL